MAQQHQLTDPDRFRTLLPRNNTGLYALYPSATESSSSLSGYHTGNRSRANTTSEQDNSSISSSSENDDTGGDSGSISNVTSAAGKLLQRAAGGRRRSHRPRGCRGGRKNRKKRLNAQNNAAAVPNEIVEHPLKSSTNENLQHDDLSVKDHSPNFQLPVSAVKTAFWCRTQHENNVVPQNHLNPHQPQSDENMAGCAAGLQHPSLAYGGYSNSVGPPTSQPSSTENTGIIQQPSMFSLQGCFNQFLFRPVQESGGVSFASDTHTSSSGAIPWSEGAPGPVVADCGRHNGNYSQLGEASVSNDILPPPLPNVKSESPVFFEGPNPYALSTAVSTLSNCFVDVSLSLTDPSFYHSESMLSSKSGESNSTSNSNTGEVGGAAARATASDVTAKPYDAHKNQRIEKQRQMLADGGSLFATSPRSFLMGGAAGSAAKSLMSMAW